MHHPTGAGTGGAASILPSDNDNAPLSPIASGLPAHRIPDEPPTNQAAGHAVLYRAQEATTQALTEVDTALDGAGTPHPDVKAVSYKAGPSLGGPAKRLISTAIEYANLARPSKPRRYSAPTRIKSHLPLGASDSAVEDERFGA